MGQNQVERCPLFTGSFPLSLLPSFLSLSLLLQPLMTFTVRYIDFGNSEERQQHELIPLGSKFRLLPPRAIHCSVATTDHVTFTQAVKVTAFS